MKLRWPWVTLEDKATVMARRMAVEMIVDLERAIEPFAEFASNVDENGWTSNIHHETISTWFGPSDFRNAQATLKRIKEMTD